MKSYVLSTLLVSVMSCNLAFADKPDHAGSSKDRDRDQSKHEEGFDRQNNHSYDRDDGRSSYFDDTQRRLIHDYYYGQMSQGKCPPGLAKKGNGCQAPGQAKQWSKGKPLAKGVVYHDLPYDLMRRLPPPPRNHRYVEVAGDILLIAIGTSMVVDALDDILR